MHSTAFCFSGSVFTCTQHVTPHVTPHVTCPMHTACHTTTCHTPCTFPMHTTCHTTCHISHAHSMSHPCTQHVTPHVTYSDYDAWDYVAQSLAPRKQEQCQTDDPRKQEQCVSRDVGAPQTAHDATSNGIKFLMTNFIFPSSLPRAASVIWHPFFLAFLRIVFACSSVTLPLVFLGAVAGSGYTTWFEI